MMVAADEFPGTEEIVHGARGEGISPVVLLKGLPACGKSYVAQWMTTTHGFIGYDTDQLQSARVAIQHGCHRLCGHPHAGSCRSSETAGDLLYATGASRHPLWRAMHAFQAAGAVTWWFSGPPERARECLQVRGTGSPRDFDRQIDLTRGFKT